MIESDYPVNVAPSRISTYQSKKIIPQLGNWSERLDNLLLGSYDQFPKNWHRISIVLGEKKTPDECRERYKAIKICKVEGRFTQEEDTKISKGVDLYGKNFALIQKKYFKNRTPKQIRDRYMKTILKNKQMATEKQLKTQFTIRETEEEADTTPREVDRTGVKIHIGSLSKEPEKRLQNLGSYFAKNPLMHDKPSKKDTETSFFTDESFKDHISNGDIEWYENVGKNNKNRWKEEKKLMVQEKNTNNSKENWKNMMSVSSNNTSSKNAEKLFAKATMHLTVDKNLIKSQISLFKSKDTFQAAWHNNHFE